MNNVSEDVSILSTIPQDTINKLLKEVTWSICHSVEEDLLNNNTLTKIDIGLGTLLISNEEDTIKYKFIPSSTLEDSVKETILSKKSPLESILEDTLIRKILHTYKDIF